MNFLTDPLTRGYARVTGLFYAIIAVAGFFAILYVPSQLFTPGDGAASLAAIAREWCLFRAGVAGDVAVMLAELGATTMLYFMFRHVNHTLSVAAALARLLMVAVMATMLFFYAGAQALAEGVVTGLAEETRAALGLLLLEMHATGIMIWQLFFWVHLLILGQLVARSGLYPRLLGHAMSLGSFGYLFDSINKFTTPDGTMLGDLTGLLLIVVSVAEIGFALWLIIRGPRRA